MAGVQAPSTFAIAQNNGVNYNPWSDLMFKTMNVQNQQYTPEEANKTFDFIRTVPEYKAQNEGISDLENELSRLKKLPAQSGNSWVKPLLALVDSETGSNLMAGYQEDDSLQKRNDMILKYQDAIANRKKQAADTLMSGLGKFKSGTKTDVGGTDMTGAKLGVGMAQTDANNQTKVDTAKISAAARKGGAGRDKFNDAFYAAAGKKAVDEASAGQGSQMTQSAADLRSAADIIRKAQNNAISPSGSFGWLRDKVATNIYPEVAAAKSTFSKEAVKSMADSFKGSMSDADRDMMIKSAYDEGADEEVNAKRAETIAAIMDKNVEKAQIYNEYLSAGLEPRDIVKRMTEADSHLNRKYKIGTGTAGAKKSQAAPSKKTFSSEELGF